MKIITMVLVLLLPLIVHSQPPQFNEEQMQQMMQQAAEMQACFANVDRSRLEALAQQARQMEAEVKGLCADGKRGEAERKAMKFGMEISTSEDMKAMRKCGEKMRAMLPPALFEMDPEQQRDSHICDGM